MPSNHLILCHPPLFLPSILPSIRVFSDESALCIRWPKYWSFSFSISPSNEHPGLISFRMDWSDLLTLQGTLRSLLQHHSSKASILRHSALFVVQLSYPYMTTGKTIALTRQTFVDKVMSLIFNMLSRLVITFLPRSKCLLISWLQSPSAVILEPRKIKSATVSLSISSISQKEKDVQNQGGGLAQIQHVDLLWSKCAEIIYTLLHLKIPAISYKDVDFWSPGFRGGSVVKNPPANAGDTVLIRGLGRFPGGNGNTLQYSCLENPMDGGAWWATVCGVAKGWTQLNTHTHGHKPTRSYGVGGGNGPVWAGSLQGLSFFLLAPKEGGHQGFLGDFPVGG